MAQQDFMPFDANEYRAVVNPSGLVQQAWGYGRRLVFVPGELDNPRRAPVQFVKTRIARKAVKNRRRFLQLMTVEQGMRLINLARELRDFPEAYRQITGRNGTSAGEIMLERQLKSKLRRVLIHEVGVPDDAMLNWTINDMRAVIKDPTLLADVDEKNGRPRIDGGANQEQGSVFEAMERAKEPKVEVDDFSRQLFHEDFRPRPSAEDKIGETGAKGDFITPEEMTDDDKLPEEVAAESTLAYDVKSGGKVAGDVPETVAASTYRGVETTAVAPVEAKDLEEPLPEPAPIKAQEVSEGSKVKVLRAQLESIGEKWHGRSGSAKLQRDLDAAIANSVNSEASASS